MKQQILEEFEDKFECLYNAENTKERSMHYVHDVVRDFLSSSIDRVLEEARKCVEEKITEWECVTDIDNPVSIIDIKTETLQALDTLKV